MSKHVSNFYNNRPEKEWNRLEHPYQQFEFVTTLDLISKYFPSKGHVCDIGCGPGRYSIELLKKGYEVTMVDLSSELLEIAKGQVAQLDGVPSPTIICADARELSMLPSGQFDAVLHLGPMYHLLERKDRLQTLRELSRILSDRGTAIVSYLNSWGILRYGVKRFPDLFEDALFLKSMLGEVTIPEAFENFTECFWSTPPKASLELSEVGFDIVTYIGCESFASGMKQPIEELYTSNQKAYENILQLVRETCELEQFRSTAEHLHFVVKKGERK